MRRSSQDRYLPPIAIQIFGALIVVVVTVAGLFGLGNPTIMLAVLALAGSFVLIGGYYEKIRGDVVRAVSPDADKRGEES